MFLCPMTPDNPLVWPHRLNNHALITYRKNASPPRKLTVFVFAHLSPVRTGDDAFDLLISVNKVNQRHVADELLMIEREGYVHTSNT